METKGPIRLIYDIAERAEEMELLESDIHTFVMDLWHADREFDLKLDELMNACDFLFALDVIGIQRNMDRETGIMRNGFVPIFVGR